MISEAQMRLFAGWWSGGALLMHVINCYFVSYITGVQTHTQTHADALALCKLSFTVLRHL